MEKALQENQGVSTFQPSQTAPTITTVFPPTVSASTTGTSTTTAAGSSTTMTTKELIKAMENLKLKVSELKESKEKLAKLEVSCDKSKMTMAEKTREEKALENKVKALEKDLSLDKPLGKIRGILWANIGESISNMRRSIQIIYEQIDLIAAAQVEIQRAKNLLGHKPEQANRLINFLNPKTKEELVALDIRDRTGTILTVKRVLTMRTLMQNLERKI